MASRIDSGSHLQRGAVPVFMAFVAMGFGDAVGPLVSLSKEEFNLSNTSAQLIPFTGYGVFAALSLPMGIFQGRHRRKSLVLAGLLVMLLGLLIPTVGLFSIGTLLVTVLLIGAGNVILQVSGNPLMRDASPPGGYARNLSFAQFFKGMGTVSSSLIPVGATVLAGASWRIMFPIYAVFVLLSVAAVLRTRIREYDAPGRRPPGFASTVALLRKRFVAAMALSIFVYIGAEVTVATQTPLLLQEQFGLDAGRIGLLGTALFVTALTAGRLVGGFLLRNFHSNTVLRIGCIISIAGLLGVYIPSTGMAITSLIFTGLGFANTFPLIFSITIRAMPEYTDALSGLLLTMVIGGALLPLVAGFTADQTGSVPMSFLIPLAAFLFISAVAFSPLTRLQAERRPAG
ncbi:MFS transporter [Streptomyces sp. NPDC051776]|uniref:MFS transporter n=1 Tax=Streptomyces sp. NPDC051776 TaxID=3155414 RepID=UPI003432C8FA